MTEALTKKKRIRAGHKASATKTIRQIDEILASEAPDKSRLSLLRLTLKEKLETIKTLDAEVIELIEDETLADEIEQADSYRESIFSALIKIDQQGGAPPTNPDPHPPTRATPTESRGSRVRLPKLQLRPFSGDLTKWTSFWESFEAAVHHNEDLSEIEKFNYLTSLLERSAREAISGLALTAANYHQAVATLKKRFGSKQQIVNKHMDALLQVECVTSSQNIRALRRLFDNISSHVRSLKSLGVEPESYGSLLCPVLITKLPADLQLIVSRKVSDTDWNLDPLMEVIEEEIIARERLGVNQSRPPARRNEYKSPPTATTLVSGETSSITTPCCYCDQLHLPTNCSTVVQVEARKQALRRSGRCFSCLRKGHLSRNCRSTNRCRTCNGRHHTSLCNSAVGQPTGDRSVSQSRSQSQPLREGTSLTILSGTEPPVPSLNPSARAHSTSVPTLNPSAPAFTSSTATSLYVDSNRAILLQTALAEVSNPHDPSLTLRLRIVMDSGSQRSYLTQRVRDTLALPASGKQRLSIAAFGSKRGEAKQCEVVRIAVRTKSGDNQEVDLFVIPHICDPLTAQPVGVCPKMYSHISQLDLADTSQDETMEVDMLIGSDYYWEFMTGETVRGRDGPVAVNTTLGWVLSGPAETTGQRKSTVSLVTTHTLRADGITTQELDNTLQSFWELESLGIQEPSNSVSDQFASTIHMKDGRYEVSLPWRECHDPLPDNYDLGRRRLYGLVRRLKQTPVILREYDAILREQLDKGIIERVEDTDETPGMIHYLPHHAVIRQDKETTKIRVVYDASARSNGPSLNDCLHTGPKFNQKILEILLRFRSYPIALVADIEKAFLMISVTPKDRDVLRFLWMDDPSSSEPRIVTLRFTRVVFGVSPSPFLLNATIKCHVGKYLSSHPELVKTLMQSIYVDDVVCGADLEDEAYALYAGSKEILGHGSFNLRKFVTNSCTLQQRIDVEEANLRQEKNVGTRTTPTEVEASEETYVEATLPADQSSGPGEQKVLGVRWNVLQDQLVFELQGIVETAMRLDPTKRNVVSLIGRIYDPLGFLSPVTVKFKVLMQELCKTKVGWDQPLEGEVLTKWRGLIDDLRRGQPMTLPRCYLSGARDEARRYRLYGFCDASTAAYAAVVYLVEEADDHKYSSFVVSKTRVSPLKAQTIPRLELLSMLLLARLVYSVTEALITRLNLEEPRCFTDSQVALFWIKGTGRDWKPFVQNRVDEVRKLVPVDCWNHCSGKENPADIPSRGMTPLELSTSKLWRNGPEWLKAQTNPVPLPVEIPEPCVAELKASSRVAVHGLLISQPPGISHIVNCERFNTIHKLYRVTAYVLKFLSMLKKKVRSPELTVQDLSEAEKLWILDSQSSMVQDRNFPTWKVQFGLFKDDKQIWRCGGRLQNAKLPFSTVHPVLLDRTHHLAKLIVTSAHSKVQHNGVKETLSEVRGKFWILKGRSLVKKLIGRCVICRRFEGLPFSAPPAPPLPGFRVNEAPPFTHTAVDFAGPLYVRGTNHSEGEKVWICLFTCCVTRALHLELVNELSTPAFIRCLKKFTARRGLPRRIVSDNAKTFKAAAKAIEAMLNHPDLKGHLLNLKVEWNFNLEKAPWWGGLFERLVKSTKRCLRKMIGQAKLSFDEMHTAVLEVESILNSRPLTYTTSEDIEEPLTPSHLLVGRRLLSLPDDLTYFQDDDPDFEPTTEPMQARVRYLNNVLNHFWRRWSHEYLLELRESHRRQAAKDRPPIKVGDVVLLKDQDKPRGFWRLARVEKLLTGKDDQVRGAEVRVSTPTGQPSKLRRPVQALYPLEVSHPVQGQLTERSCEFQGDQTKSITTPTLERSRARSTRGAATRANQKFKRWAAELTEDSNVDP